MPDKLGSQQLAGNLDGWVGEAVDNVEHMAAPALGNDRMLPAGGDVTEEGEARVVNRDVFEPQTRDGSVVSEYLRFGLLVPGHGLEVNPGMQSRDKHPGEGVSHKIVLARHVPDVSRVLGDVAEVPLLPSGPLVGHFGHGIYQWLVVGVDCEGSALSEVAKVSDSQADGQELLVVGAVVSLRLPQLATEEGYWLSTSTHMLLQGCTKALIGSIGNEAERGALSGMGEHVGTGQGSLGLLEGLVHLVSPGEGAFGRALQLSREALVERLHGCGNLADKAVVEVNHSSELVQLLGCNGAGEVDNGVYL